MCAYVENVGQPQRKIILFVLIKFVILLFVVFIWTKMKEKKQITGQAALLMKRCI